MCSKCRITSYRIVFPYFIIFIKYTKIGLITHKMMLVQIYHLMPYINSVFLIYFIESFFSRNCCELQMCLMISLIDGFEISLHQYIR